MALSATLTSSHSLRGADAVHLASAPAIGDPELVFAVWNRTLHAGAQAANLCVAPLELHSRRSAHWSVGIMGRTFGDTSVFNLLLAVGGG